MASPPFSSTAFCTALVVSQWSRTAVASRQRRCCSAFAVSVITFSLASIAAQTSSASPWGRRARVWKSVGTQSRTRSRYATSLAQSSSETAAGARLCRCTRCVAFATLISSFFYRLASWASVHFASTLVASEIASRHVLQSRAVCAPTVPSSLCSIWTRASQMICRPTKASAFGGIKAIRTSGRGYFS